MCFRGRPSGSRCSPASCPAPSASTPSAVARSRTSSARRSPGARRSSACSRCAGRSPSRSTARWRCAWRPTPSRSAASCPFAQAAFRQAFAGARNLEEPDNVLIAAAACEMHPAAVLRGAELRSVASQLAAATAAAARTGIIKVPAIVVGESVFEGERAVEQASAQMDAAMLQGGTAMKANRAYRLIVTRAGRAPALLADAERVDHIEIVEIDERRGRAVLGPPAARRLAPGTRAARRARPAGGRGVPRPLEYRGALMGNLPEPELAREWLATMTLIRRFEERAGEMYARAKVGGFLHLSIGEEATIVGSARALRDSDYLISTYRSHGHALVRGTPPENVMAELFGRVDGCSGGRGGSMHMFDLARRFMGGYGIVGGNLPIAAGIALACDYRGLRGRHPLHVRRRRLQPGHLRRDPEPGGAVEAAGGLHGDQQPVRHGHRAAAPLRRHRPAAQGREPRRARDALRRHGRPRHPRRRLRGRPPRARGAPAAARRGGHLPLPRPLDGRPRAVPLQGGGRAVARARPDPRVRRAARPRGRDRRGAARRRSTSRRWRAWTPPWPFAESSPFPAPESLYDDVYVLDQQSHGSYSVKTTPLQERSAESLQADGTDEIPQQITDALLHGEDAS